MDWNDIGLIAGVLSSSGFLAQIYKGYKSKSLEDLSYLMLIIVSAGLFLWLLYGIHFNNIPIIFANTLAGTCMTILLLMKFKYSKSGEK